MSGCVGDLGQTMRPAALRPRLSTLRVASADTVTGGEGGSCLRFSRFSLTLPDKFGSEAVRLCVRSLIW